MTNRDALKQSLARMGELAGFEAEIQAAFAIADEIDAGNGTPEMFREYRFSVRTIREAVGDDDPAGSDVAKLLARLGGTDVLDSKDGG
jgi:hypothetical protein